LNLLYQFPVASPLSFGMDLLGGSLTRCPGRERIRAGGFMNILAALRQAEAKLKK
jgi:hypothetical protein